MNRVFKKFEHPAAWKAADLGSAECLSFELAPKHVDAMLNALDNVRARGIADEHLSRSSFLLPEISSDISDWRSRMNLGPGIIRMRGFPVTQLPVEDLATLFLGLGCHFGIPVSQSSMGEVVGHVVNIGGMDRRERAYRNNRALDLHTDRCDTIGMLCIRKAKSGGVSGYTSALAVHNELLSKKPELLTPLYEGFRLHRFGEQPEGESPITEHKIPIFSVSNGFPNVIYIRGYISLATQEGYYELTALEQDALDTFDELASSDTFCLDMTLQPGEATFTNNCLLLHRRTTFEDHPEPERKRHLLRLWLFDPERPADARVRVHKSIHGIVKRDHHDTYYRGPGWTEDRYAY